MTGVAVGVTILILSLWQVSWLLHQDIRHLEILVRQIDETLNNKL